MILKQKQRKALFEVVCMGQWAGTMLPRPSRAERKAAKWAQRVLDQHKNDRRIPERR